MMNQDKSNIGIPQYDLKIMLPILQKFPADYYLFGSRAEGAYRWNSDIDLCVKGNLSPMQLAQLEEALTESDMLLRVDVVPESHLGNNAQATKMVPLLCQ